MARKETPRQREERYAHAHGYATVGAYRTARRERAAKALGYSGRAERERYAKAFGGTTQRSQVVREYVQKQDSFTARLGLVPSKYDLQGMLAPAEAYQDLLKHAPPKPEGHAANVEWVQKLGSRRYTFADYLIEIGYIEDYEEFDELYPAEGE